eukprot:jgi/Picsp_1/5442/NSC_02801-R1_regulatory factor sgt1
MHVEQEHAVEYRLYPLDREIVGDRLRELKKDILEFVGIELLENDWYIWQRDVFCLHVSTSARGSGGRTAHGEYLWGRVRFEDNIDDEWFVVWLLREISSRFGNLAVKLWDDDGEFLLVEAAYALPRWLSPEIADNRLWIVGGEFCCVPDGRAGGEKGGVAGKVSVDQAIGVLCGFRGGVVEHGRKLKGPIERKIQAYPEYARESMHRAVAILPAEVGALLVKKPQLITESVRAFCDSSAQERVQASRNRNFPADDGMVPVLVKFNRCSYAQLWFAPDMGPPSEAWATRMESSDGDEATAKALMLGLKICMGFEIMDNSRVEKLKQNSSQSGGLNLSKDILDSSAIKTAGDDETWLYKPSETLDEELRIRERELLCREESKRPESAEDGSTFDPDELSQRMKQFVDTVATLEGATIQDEEIRFNERDFLRELNQIGIMVGPQDADTSEDEGSSFYSNGSHSSSSAQLSNSASSTPRSGRDGVGKKYASLDINQDEKKQHDMNDAGCDGLDTETDSDDAFYENYDEVLAQQLRGTSMDASFSSKKDYVVDGNTVKQQESNGSGCQKFASAEDRPIDLDFNLVSNLLSSYEEQAGQAGPASNLAALLGVALPTSRDTQQDDDDGS